MQAKTIERIQTAFVILLAGFFVLVTYHDSMRLKKRMQRPTESAELPVFRKSGEGK
jgi:cbb3-type cytochrome oxidase subunit 3